jgi:two-component system sensor histidine kinase HydH
MTRMYFYLVLVNAAVSVAAAAAVWWRNRYQAVGPLLGGALWLHGLWLIGLAQYFWPWEPEQAMWWAQVTLSVGLLTQPLMLQALCALVGRMGRYRWWIAAAYLSAMVFVGLVWRGAVIEGLRPSPFLHHYIGYNRALYGVMGLHFVVWQALGAVVLARSAWQASGYQRAQLLYFIVAWFTAFFTINLIILPMKYDFNIPPFGFFILPFNFAFLAYVMATARLADYNVVIARFLLHAVTVLIVALVTLLLVGAVILVAPELVTHQQVLLTVAMVTVMGIALSTLLPRFLPRAERLMQERLFGSRYGYQDVLAGLVRELPRLPTIDQVLGMVASQVHSQMGVTRVLILMEDMVSGEYRLQAQSGLADPGGAGLAGLGAESFIVRWLRRHRDALVREELQRRLPEEEFREAAAEMGRLGVSVCMPMFADDRLTGFFGLGPKANHEMFFVSDLNLLATIASEAALAVQYRRMEEEVFRKNRLVELGTIAAGVAHEIRNPLASIRTFAQLLPTQVDDPEFKNEFSKLVLKDVDRITKVVESMLAFARPAQVAIGEHPADGLVEEAVLLVQSRLKSKRIELTVQQHARPVLQVDRNQILQVLVNLLNNAVDALSELGRIRIAVGIQRMPRAEGNGQRQDFAVIEVADNGPGIPAAARTRLFDPFFTTKKEGTGLGLSISQKIVRDHGGSITVSSIEGQGTTFRINLPL